MPPSFSPTCPSCSTGHGVPNMVGFTGNQRTVTYHCSSCGLAWTASDYVPRLVALEPPIPSPRSPFFQK